MDFEYPVFLGKQTRQAYWAGFENRERLTTVGFECSAFRTGARCMAFADWGSSDPRQSQLKVIRETAETAVMTMHHFGWARRKGPPKLRAQPADQGESWMSHMKR